MGFGKGSTRLREPPPGAEEAAAKRDSSSYYVFGRKGVLKVIDVESGRTLSECPRQALDMGLAWSTDSTKVYFVSLADSGLLSTGREEIQGTTSYGRAHATDPRLARRVFSFDMSSSAVADLMRGESPRIASGILFAEDGDQLLRRDSDGKVWKVADLQNTSRGYDVSPDTSLCLISSRWKASYRYEGFLYVTSFSEPHRRLLLATNHIHNFRWVGTKPSNEP